MRDQTAVNPVYAQIALDIALRITRGELQEHTRVYGRSVMSSEYGVSPETIRRAMRLLEDMQVVATKQNSGTVILSADNAAKYVERFGAKSGIRSLLKKLTLLVRQQESLNHEISDIASSVIRAAERSSGANPFNNYEADIPSDSSLIGHSLGEIMFWQQTGATVIAIRRGDRITLSPGPNAVFEAGDTIIFVGDVPSVEAVSAIIHH